MILKILTLLLVIHTSTCLKKSPAELKHIKKPITTECQEISCPAVEDSVCMKIKNKHSNITAFVKLLNKCEMGYMKCHKDMEGSTVPMKYCDHYHLMGKRKNSHVRRKRSLADASGDKNEEAPDASDGEPDNAFVISSHEKGTPTPGGEDEKKESSSANVDFVGENEYDDKYRSDCPTACPSRIQLVCAKCDHGVYKTFLSVCHVRMFNCGQDNEKMQLVSRRSCMYSSPLLTTDEEADKIKMEPEGKVYDRDDGDPVLAFIRCRNRNSVMMDEKGYEVLDASACKNIGQEMRKDKDYDNK